MATQNTTQALLTAAQAHGWTIKSPEIARGALWFKRGADTVSVYLSARGAITQAVLIGSRSASIDTRATGKRETVLAWLRDAGKPTAAQVAVIAQANHAASAQRYADRVESEARVAAQVAAHELARSIEAERTATATAVEAVGAATAPRLTLDAVRVIEVAGVQAVQWIVGALRAAERESYGIDGKIARAGAAAAVELRAQLDTAIEVAHVEALAIEAERALWAPNPAAVEIEDYRVASLVAAANYAPRARSLAWLVETATARGWLAFYTRAGVNFSRGAYTVRVDVSNTGAVTRGAMTLDYAPVLWDTIAVTNGRDTGKRETVLAWLIAGASDHATAVAADHAQLRESGYAAVLDGVSELDAIASAPGAHDLNGSTLRREAFLDGHAQGAAELADHRAAELEAIKRNSPVYVRVTTPTDAVEIWRAAFVTRVLAHGASDRELWGYVVERPGATSAERVQDVSATNVRGLRPGDRVRYTGAAESDPRRGRVFTVAIGTGSYWRGMTLLIDNRTGLRFETMTGALTPLDSAAAVDMSKHARGYRVYLDSARGACAHTVIAQSESAAERAALAMMDHTVGASVARVVELDAAAVMAQP